MRRYYSAIYLIVSIILIVIFGLSSRLSLPLRWALVMAVFIALLMLIGRDITGNEEAVRLRSGRTETRFAPGRIDGVLIDARNKISLSRLQLVLWTVVVLSAWVTLGLHRVIPVLEGRVLASDAQVVQAVAGVLAGEAEVGEEQINRAAAVVEQVMGEEAVLPGEGTADDPPTARYQPLDIAFPQELLVALGISIASMAGAGVIRTNQATRDDGRAQDVAATRTANAKDQAAGANGALESLQYDYQSLEAMTTSGLETMEEGGQVDQAALAEAQAQMAKMEAELRTARSDAERAQKRATELEVAQETAVGELHTHMSIAEARWSDMVRGDTVANFQFTDLGKIQMFLFTVILVFSYAALIWSIMTMPQAAQVLQLVPSIRLPEFSQSLVYTMALSHGGYLVTKTTV